MRRSAWLATIAFSLFSATASVSYAQSTARTYAIPPSEKQLDNLHLKTVWAINLPIDGRRDSMANIQVVDRDQIFAQTKSGFFMSIDSRTGSQLWSYQFPNGQADAFPAAVNSKYVFVANLSTLYCFSRFSGQLEFQFEPTIKLDTVMSTITSGPVCDEEYLYVTIANQDILGYRIPGAVKQPDQIAKADQNQVAQITNKPKNPADQIASRYPSQVRSSEVKDPPSVSRSFNRPEVMVNTSQVAPSLTLLPSVNPPYEIKDRNGIVILRVDSLTAINSLRYPYQIFDQDKRYVVKSPSVTVIPPSVYRAFELNDIRPKGLKPEREWLYQATNRLAFEPVIAGSRLWLTFQSQRTLAFDRLDKVKRTRTIQADGKLSSSPAAGYTTDGNMGYLPLSDGSLVSVDLKFGGTNTENGAIKEMWRSNVGGPMNFKPLLTPDYVYTAGSGYGVARINRKNGEVNWRTNAEDDFVLAINDEMVYTRNRNGVVRVYDQKSPVDPITKIVPPVGQGTFSGFTVPVTNSITDRLFISSENGLLVCLRDSAAKFANPKMINPKADKSGDKTAPVKDEASPAMEDKKMEEQKK